MIDYVIRLRYWLSITYIYNYNYVILAGLPGVARVFTMLKYYMYAPPSPRCTRKCMSSPGLSSTYLREVSAGFLPISAGKSSIYYFRRYVTLGRPLPFTITKCHTWPKLLPLGSYVIVERLLN